MTRSTRSLKIRSLKNLNLFILLALVSSGLAFAANLPRQNAPHEAGPYSYWYGNPHAHTTRTDGGGDSSIGQCNSSTSRVDGAYPDNAYTTAKGVGRMDWLMVSMHNHLLDDASGFDTLPPFDASGIYAQSRAMADSATDANFVGILGMEWGTISGCGHMMIYDSPGLIGWEAGSYDTFSAKCVYSGAGGLYDNAAQPATVSPETGLAHLSFCHPSSSTMFESYTRDAFGDAAVHGVAVISGPSTGCNLDFPGAGTGSTSTYKNRYIKLLDAGWKVAPEGHQDNHGDNYGTHSQIRTVILADQLTRECLLYAQAQRRLYATQDMNGQLIFTAIAQSNGVTHHMGEAIGGSGSVDFHVSWWDPDNDEITSYRLLRGEVGTGITTIGGLTTVATGFVGVPSGAVTIDANENLGTGNYYYIVELLNAPKVDTNTRHTISAPIWVDFSATDSGSTPPACGVLSASPSATPSTICLGASSQLHANPSGGTGPYTYLWTPSTDLDFDNIEDPVSTATVTRTYTVVVTDSLFATSAPEQVTVTVDPGPAPSAPSNVTATGGDGQITLVWDNVIGSGDYHIYRATGDCATGSFVWVLSQIRSAGATNSWIDLTVINGTGYCYLVTADTGGCESSSSSCDPAACAVPGSVPEVSPLSSAEPLTVQKGTPPQLIFEGEWMGVYEYHLYHAASRANLEAGTYDSKFCDLENNTLGTWVTDGATYVRFTLSDTADAPAGDYIIVADSGFTEGLYGFNSDGAARASDSDKTTPADNDCPLPPVGCTTELFISEYVEGSSYNKAIEIYNGTGAPVDLLANNYSLEIYFNGSATPGTVISLTGVVADNDVFIVCDDGADAGILSVADQTDSASFFNGDDAVVLKNNGVVVDSIGQVGVDPGSEWGSGLTSTQNNTLRRLPAITGGDTNPNDSFDPAVEWSGSAQDDFSGLDTHTVDGCGPPPVGCGAELFISEYIEGSSFNKAIEIYNETGALVDLAAGGYTLEFYFNGNGSPGTTIALTGTVADGDVYVVSDDGAAAGILAETDQTSASSFFNGDDAVLLKKSGATIDAIGQVGFDPGSEWGTGNTSTQNNTIRRMDTVTAGDTNSGDAFDPSIEWDGYAQDDFTGLGAHTITCP